MPDNQGAQSSVRAYSSRLPASGVFEIDADVIAALGMTGDPRNDPSLRALYGRMLRSDLALFSKEVLRLEIGPHIVAWSSLVNRKRRLAINAARDHSKSTFFSYAYPIWQAWREPGCEVYLFSKTLEQAQEFVDIIIYGRANLLGMVDIPELQHLVPRQEQGGPKNPRVRLNRSDVRFTNGSRIRAVGYGKAVRGRHPKYIVLDDPLNDEDMWSETTRRKNIEYFKSAITNMLTPDGQMIVVGCVTPDTYVATVDRGLVRMRDLAPGPLDAQTHYPLVQALHGREGEVHSKGYWVNGETETRKLVLREGYMLEGSTSHQVWTWGPHGQHGWRKLVDLSVGDCVALRAGLRAFGRESRLDAVEAFQLGYWLGAQEGEPDPRWGLEGPRTPERLQIPEHVMQSPENIVAALLRGLYAAAGTVDDAEVTLVVASPETALQAQQLLLNFGVCAEREPYAGGWRLRSLGPEAVRYELRVDQEGSPSYETRLVWRRVESVEPGHAMTVDFADTTDHSYVSAGLISHNTPYHAGDLYGFLRSNEVYTFCRYPGIIVDPATGEQRALFPWRWTLKRLHDKKREIGSVSFAREIECLPISDDISIFPSFLFPPCYANEMSMRIQAPELARRGWVSYLGVDIARSANVGADYFVIFCIVKDGQGNTIINDIRRSKGLPFRQQLHEIEIAAKLYDPALIFIESNAMQQLYTDEMRRMTDLPVQPFTTLATNKYPLDKGVPSLRIQLETGKTIIPRGDALSRQLTDLWIAECTQFGFIDGKLRGIGTHDDMVMAWWIANEASKAGGFSFSFDDEQKSGHLLAENDGESEEAWEDVMLGADDAQDEPSLAF